MTRAAVARAAPAALVAVLLAAPLRADDQESASAFFRAGTAAFARKDYRAAAQSFEAAFTAAPHGGARYNAGLAWESAGEPARAADAFAAAMAVGGLSASSAADARDRLARLQPRLARVQVIADGGRVSVAHVRDAPAPQTIHLAPGRYALEVTFAGGELRTEEVEARAGVMARVAIRAPSPVAGDGGGAGTMPGDAARPGSGARDEAPGETQRLVGWIGVGAGAVGVGVGLAIGAAGISARDDYADGGRIDPDLRDNAVALRTWANVGIISGGVLAAAGVVLLLTAPRQAATASGRSVWVGANAGGATLGGRF